ncbi:MAG: hypothetical protein AABX28_01595 [Nanoarchaeota archaeon]
MNKKFKSGEILVENVVFIILNLIFLSILILFIVSETGNAALLEQKYAKEIALIIDSAKPGMTIKINMKDAFEEAESIGYSGNMVSVDGNNVKVKLREKGGYSYHLFNDVDVNVFPDISANPVKDYIIKINKYNE